MIKFDNDYFRVAQTTKEAEMWAKKYLDVQFVNYKGFDVALAELINNELNYQFKIFPEIKGSIKFIGTIQERNKLYSVFNKKTRKYVKSHTYANSCDFTWGNFQGIAFNIKWIGDYNKFFVAVCKDVKSGYHPIGTNNLRSIIEHEFAHQVEYYLKKIKLWDKHVLPVWEKYKDVCSDLLSKYSSKNISEFFAEGYSASSYIAKYEANYYEEISENRSSEMDEPCKLAYEFRDLISNILWDLHDIKQNESKEEISKKNSLSSATKD